MDAAVALQKAGHIAAGLKNSFQDRVKFSDVASIGLSGCVAVFSAFKTPAFLPTQLEHQALTPRSAKCTGKVWPSPSPVSSLPRAMPNLQGPAFTSETAKPFPILAKNRYNIISNDAMSTAPHTSSKGLALLSPA